MPQTPDVAEELDEETRILCECGHTLAEHFGCSYECTKCHCIDFNERPVKTIYERILDNGR